MVRIITYYYSLFDTICLSAAQDWSLPEEKDAVHVVLHLYFVPNNHVLAALYFFPQIETIFGELSDSEVD